MSLFESKEERDNNTTVKKEFSRHNTIMCSLDQRENRLIENYCREHSLNKSDFARIVLKEFFKSIGSI